MLLLSLSATLQEAELLTLDRKKVDFNFILLTFYSRGAFLVETGWKS